MIVYIGHIMNVTDDKFYIVCPVLIYSFWLAIVWSVLLGFMASVWPLYCLLSCFDLQLLIGHFIVCLWIYGFWLHLRLWYIFKLFFGHYKKTCTFSTNHFVVQSIYGKKWPNLKLIAKELNSRFSCAKISSQYDIKNKSLGCRG